MMTTPESAPPMRRAAALVVGVEALALVAIAGWIGVSALGGDGSSAMAAAIALTALLAGGVLAWASAALWRGAAWPRGLALTWQLLQGAAGVTVVDWSALAGATVIAAAVAGAAVLFVDARRDNPQVDEAAPGEPDTP
ncbi:MAG: hypothetical protein ACK4MD_02445 [Demequina sp.]